MKRAWIIAAMGFVLAAWAAFTFSFTPLRSSHDEFWHLKAGKWIAENGRLPEHDIFTYTAAHMEWHNHEWLTQIAMWKIYDLAENSGFIGWRAIILMKSIFIILAFAGFGLLLARRMTQPVWAAVAAALAVALARRTFYPRPPYITYFLMALVLWLLIEWRSGRINRNWLWVMAPLFALWANLHGGWMAGLILIGAFWADLLLARDFKQLKFITAVGVACGISTFINPYGWKLLLLPGRALGDPYLAASIGEMLPPEWRFVWVLGGVLLLLAAAAIRPRKIGWLVLTFISLWLWWFSDLRARPIPLAQFTVVLPILFLAARRSGLPGWTAHFLLISFFGWQAMAHVRHLPLFAIVLMPTLAALLEGWGAWRWKQPLGLALLAALAVFWTFNRREGFSYAERNIMLARGEATQPSVWFRNPQSLPVPSDWPQSGVVVTQAYPERAVNFLLQAGLPGRIFNGGNYAGYLIWRLSPETHRVFTDNRYDVFGAIAIRDEHSVLRGYDEADARHMGEGFRAWNAILDDWDVQTVFLPADVRGTRRLAESGNWVRVYEDFQWAIWVRDTPENRAIIERARLLPRPLPWIR